MKRSRFYPDQYVDADSFDSMAQGIDFNFNCVQQGMFIPGLIRPEKLLWAMDGYRVTITAFPDFFILFGSGRLAGAFGAVNDQTSNDYVLDLLEFDGEAVYIVASLIELNQTTTGIVGPPLGHPDYDPNFLPYVASLEAWDSIQITVSQTPADNNLTFELARFDFVDNDDITNLNLNFQQRASELHTFGTGRAAAPQFAIQPSIFYLDESYFSKVTELTVEGAYVLPSLYSANGRSLTLVASSGARIFVVTNNALTRMDFDSDGNPTLPKLEHIRGTQPQPVYPAYGFILGIGAAYGEAVTICALHGYWQIISGRPRVAAFKIALTAGLNLYVGVGGSDSNDGLTEQTPFATIQKSIDFITANLDQAGFPVTIHVDDGTYAAGARITVPTNGQLRIVGNTSSPANVVITAVTSSCFNVYNNCIVDISGFRVTATGSWLSWNGYGILAAQGAIVSYSNMEFGYCEASHVVASTAQLFCLTGTNRVTGGAGKFHVSIANSGIGWFDSVTTNFIGSASFGIALYQSINNSALALNNLIYSGPVSGAQYSLQWLSFLAVNNTTVPGSSGSADTSSVVAATNSNVIPHGRAAGDVDLEPPLTPIPSGYYGSS